MIWHEECIHENVRPLAREKKQREVNNEGSGQQDKEPGKQMGEGR